MKLRTFGAAVSGILLAASLVACGNSSTTDNAGDAGDAQVKTELSH